MERRPVRATQLLRRSPLAQSASSWSPQWARAFGLGVQASAAPIPFGSSGAIAVSGTPYDSANPLSRSSARGPSGDGTHDPWAVDNVRLEDARVFGRGNGRLGSSRAAPTSRSKSSSRPARKALGFSFNGLVLQLNLGTDGSSIPNTTAATVQAYFVAEPRLRAAFLAFIPSGDGRASWRPPIRADDRPAQTWSASILVPNTGIVAIKNNAVDTGVIVTSPASLTSATSGPRS